MPSRHEAQQSPVTARLTPAAATATAVPTKAADWARFWDDRVQATEVAAAAKKISASSGRKGIGGEGSGGGGQGGGIVTGSGPNQSPQQERAPPWRRAQ